MPERSSVFDMIGPVMIGPSSSHTAGVVRIGRVTRRLLTAAPQQATVTFYNSFAATHEGHGSDRAVLAGLLDFKTDDERIREAKDHARAAGLTWRFRSVMSASKLHPNTVRIEAEGNGHSVDVVGVSRGGGLISIQEVDGFHTNFTAQDHTVLIDAHDRPGSIAYIAAVIANDRANIATMTVARRAKNDRAKLVLETDHALKDLSVEYLRGLDWVERVLYLPQIDL